MFSLPFHCIFSRSYLSVCVCVRRFFSRSLTFWCARTLACVCVCSLLKNYFVVFLFVSGLSFVFIRFRCSFFFSLRFRFHRCCRHLETSRRFNYLIIVYSRMCTLNASERHCKCVDAIVVAVAVAHRRHRRWSRGSLSKDRKFMLITFRIVFNALCSRCFRHHRRHAEPTVERTQKNYPKIDIFPGIKFICSCLSLPFVACSALICVCSGVERGRRWMRTPRVSNKRNQFRSGLSACAYECAGCRCVHTRVCVEKSHLIRRLSSKCIHKLHSAQILVQMAFRRET